MEFYIVTAFSSPLSSFSSLAKVTCLLVSPSMHRRLICHCRNLKNNFCILFSCIYRAIQQHLSREPVALIDENLGNNVSTNIWVSFAEFTMKTFMICWNPSHAEVNRQKLRIRSNNGVPYIKGLTTVSVSSGLEAYLILQFGLHHLNYAATSLNEHSSRSHCIFTLQFVQASNVKKGVHVSVLSFCDLAGLDRIKKSNNAGDRLKESNSINTSLLVLGRCIKQIRDNQKCKESRLIPFRESKLTQLFQIALLGNEAISMIVNINPTCDMFDETQHVLNFAAIAKSISVLASSVNSVNNSRKCRGFLPLQVKIIHQITTLT